MILLCVLRAALRSAVLFGESGEVEDRVKAADGHVRLELEDGAWEADFLSPRTTLRMSYDEERERIALVGGELSVERRAPCGAKLDAKLPPTSVSEAGRT